MGDQAISEKVLLESCKIAQWQIYHAGWRDKKEISDIKVDMGDSLFSHDGALEVV